MQEKCCCGCCSLSRATSVVLVITAIEALWGLFFNIEILLCVDSQSYNPLTDFINVSVLEDLEVLHGIVLSAIGLNSFWFLFGLLAARGNTILSHGRLTPWILITYVITLFNLGTTIYFAVKLQGAFSGTDQFYIDYKPTKTLSYLTLLILYSGGGFLLFFNVYLAHIMEKRGKEIDHDYFTLALYLRAHLRRCSQLNQACRQHHPPEAPPSYTSYCPPYLPPTVMQRTNESSGSSWSLSCETIRTLSSGQPDSPINQIPGTRKSLPSTDLSGHNRNWQPVNVDTSYVSALPY